jgi:hypothetical protein
MTDNTFKAIVATTLVLIAATLIVPRLPEMRQGLVASFERSERERAERDARDLNRRCASLTLEAVKQLPDDHKCAAWHRYWR